MRRVESGRGLARTALPIQDHDARRGHGGRLPPWGLIPRGPGRTRPPGPRSSRGPMRRPVPRGPDAIPWGRISVVPRGPAQLFPGVVPRGPATIRPDGARQLHWINALIEALGNPAYAAYAALLMSLASLVVSV